MKQSGLLAALLAVLTGGCESMTRVGCTLVPTPAIRVSVRDSVANTPYTGPVTARAIDGAFVDSVSLANLPLLGDSTLVWLAFDRAGTYLVQLQAPSYQLWQHAGVRVDHDGCYPETVTLTARLQRI